MFLREHYRYVVTCPTQKCIIPWWFTYIEKQNIITKGCSEKYMLRIVEGLEKEHENYSGERDLKKYQKFTKNPNSYAPII
jgi:hypothetical protein